MRGVIRAIACVVVVVLAGCGETGGSGGSTSSGTPSPSAPAKVYTVGQTMTNGAHQTVTVSNYQSSAPASQFSTPNPGNKCIGVTVALFNGDSSPWTQPTTEFAVVDSSGQTHDDFSSFSCGTSSTIDSLVPNGRATASLFFEVPATGNLTFQWTPNALNASSVYDTKLQ